MEQERDLETEFKEVCSADTGVGEDAGTILNGEEQGDSWTEEEGRVLLGEGEQCLRLGLTAKGSNSATWPREADVSNMLEVFNEDLAYGWLGLDRLAWECEQCWSVSLEKTKSTD